MSEKEKKDKVNRMKKMASEYEARTGRKPSQAFLAAIESQGSITINDVAYMY